MINFNIKLSTDLFILLLFHKKGHSINIHVLIYADGHVCPLRREEGGTGILTFSSWKNNS